MKVLPQLWQIKLVFVLAIEKMCLIYWPVDRDFANITGNLAKKFVNPGDRKYFSIMKPAFRFAALLIPLLFVFSSCEEVDLGHDMYVVRQGNLYGYINSGGVIEISPQFAFCMPFSENLAAVNVGGRSREGEMPIDGKWGFIDMYGNFILNPVYHSPENGAPPFSRLGIGTILHEAYEFHEHLAAVRTDDGWRYIDTLGNPMVQNFRLESCRAFHEGLACVMVGNYWGYIEKVRSVDGSRDSAIQFRIEPSFLYPADFHDGFAMVKDKDGREICINKNGNQVFSQYRIESQFHQGMAAVRARFRGEPVDELNNQKFSLMDTAGRVWFEPQFDEVRFYSSGMAPVRVGSNSRGIKHKKFSDYDGGKWGFVNRDGHFVINPVFDELRHFSEDRAPARMGPYWGYIDENGGWVTPPEFLWVGDFRHGVATVLLGPNQSDFYNHYAYIDRQGDVFWVEP